MTIWAIADLHLYFGTPSKTMDAFGGKWLSHPEKLKKQWLSYISPEDLVLLAGDFSWALHPEELLPDLSWLEKLPGTKVMIKGNHDLWWGSYRKAQALLPPSIHLIQNNAFNWKEYTIGGTRLWENPSVDFSQHIVFQETPGINVHPMKRSDEELKQDQKTLLREIQRLKLSLASMREDAKKRIVMLHYPPTGPEHNENEITNLLTQANIDVCLYGHLHNLNKNAPANFEIGSTKYYCTSCDFLNFVPLEVFPREETSRPS